MPPIYDFTCPTCGKTLELLQAMSAPQPLCDDRHEPTAMLKLATAPGGIELKGSGWFKPGFTR